MLSVKIATIMYVSFDEYRKDIRYDPSGLDWWLSFALFIITSVNNYLINIQI